VLLMVFAAGLLAIAGIVAYQSGYMATVVLLPGIAVSFGVGWLGYKLRGWIPPEPPPDPILAAVMAPTPTTRALSPADVLGEWRFYVDAATSTVTVELLPGGRYRQAIVGNSSKCNAYRQAIVGNSSKCNATCDGQWTLDGPNLELDAYHSATQGETGRVCWYFGDCEGGLILFVKDDPQSEAMLVARRAGGGGDTPGQSPFGSDAASKRTNQPSRKAGSRGPSLFVAYGRLGHGGKSAR
jgi:hypothetical protein